MAPSTLMEDDRTIYISSLPQLLYSVESRGQLFNGRLVNECACFTGRERKRWNIQNFVPFQVIAAGVFPRTKATPYPIFIFHFFFLFNVVFFFIPPPYRPVYVLPRNIFSRLVASPHFFPSSSSPPRGPSSLSSNNLPKPPPFVYCSSAVLCSIYYRDSLRNPVDLFPFLFLLFFYLFIYFYCIRKFFLFCFISWSPVTFFLLLCV